MTLTIATDHVKHDSLINSNVLSVKHDKTVYLGNPNSKTEIIILKKYSI